MPDSPVKVALSQLIDFKPLRTSCDYPPGWMEIRGGLPVEQTEGEPLERLIDLAAGFVQVIEHAGQGDQIRGGAQLFEDLIGADSVWGQARQAAWNALCEIFNEHRLPDGAVPPGSLCCWPAC